MEDSRRKRIALPKQLLSQLNIDLPTPKRSYVSPGGSDTRKARRKAARIGKKANHLRKWTSTKTERPSKEVSSAEHYHGSYPGEFGESFQDAESYNESTKESLRVKAARDPDFQAENRENKNLRKVKKALLEDDQEIAFLERKLGIKDKKALPETFAQDGLLGLLDGIDNDLLLEGRTVTKDNKDRQWLTRKRERASKPETDIDISAPEFNGIDDEDELDCPSMPLGTVTSTANTVPRDEPGAYVSGPEDSGPVLPKEASADEEFMKAQLRREVRGLINRLSEANLLAIVAKMEELYRTHSRRRVSGTLLDLVIEQVGNYDQLSEQFLVLHCGFIAALYKTIGYDFVVELVHDVATELQNSLSAPDSKSPRQRSPMNLLSLLIHLFNLSVISSELIYDFIRLLISKISDHNTQLLLKLIKSSGQQLRQEDPSSLKEIVLYMQAAFRYLKPQEISIRMKFMMETMNDLKNNKMRTSLNATDSSVEPLRRMKKLLASIELHRIKTSEPLEISLSTISRDSEPSLNQELVFQNKNQPDETDELKIVNRDFKSEDRTIVGTEDMQELALEQRMNTTVRRSIFLCLMSASDYQDAYHRLVSLHLRRQQEPEIPKVLLHCAMAEENYNPYYTFVANQLCESRRLRMSFQISLWETLRQARFEEDSTEDGLLGQPALKGIMHLAKMFAELVVHQRLDLRFMKVTNPEEMDGITHAFLEVFLLNLCLQVQRRKKKVDPEQSIINILQPFRKTPEKSHDLQLFVQQTLRHTDMLSTHSEREKLLASCDLIEATLLDMEGLVD